MHSKKLNFLFHKISTRLAIFYFLVFIIFYAIAFGLFYLKIDDYLSARDHEVIDNKIAQIEEFLNSNTLDEYIKTVQNHQNKTSNDHFMILIKKNDIEFFHMMETDYQFNLSDLQKKLFNNKTIDTWFYEETIDHDTDAMEVKEHKLKDGHSLVIGVSTANRDELLERIAKILLGISFPLFLTSVIVSFWIARKFLEPIRELSSTMKKIKEGNRNIQIKFPHFKDEFYELTSSFKEMVDQINLLIKEMKNTLDNIAHDIKTPLARARIASEYALSNPDHEELINASEETLESLNNITILIDSLMKISEFESKTFKLNIEIFNLNKLVQEVIDLYLFVAEDKDIRIVCTGDLVDLKGDRTLVKQVIANLLDNAIKYSPANTVVTINLKKEADKIFIRILDQGIGIDQFELNKIFERLYRSDKSRTESGFGLGLSLVKTIVEAHKGEITVKSQLGAGTEFLVTFPA